MTPLAAANSNRLDHLDVLRGLAVLGLLFARFPTKGGSPIALEHPDILGWSLGEQAVWLANSVMVDDAMRGLFALLFGISLWMMTGPRDGRPLVPSWSSYLVRTAGLFAFGLGFHVVLLAEASDILHVYALAGMVALVVSRLDARLLVLGGIAGFALLAAHDAMGDISTTPVTEAMIAHAASEQAAGYLDHVRQSVANFTAWSLSTGIVWKCLEAGSYMLLGLGLYRMGAFSAWSSTRLKAMLIAGYTVGIAVCGGIAVILAAGGFAEMVKAHFLTTLGKPFIVLGHTAAIMLMMRAKAPRRVLMATLAPVGRMALTLYLAGSAMMLFAFTGAGFELGPFDRYGITGMAVLGSLALIATARIWLSLFRQGPFEWALRRWTQTGQGLLGRVRPARALSNA
jgi:uncharacterized protein